MPSWLELAEIVPDPVATAILRKTGVGEALRAGRCVAFQCQPPHRVAAKAAGIERMGLLMRRAVLKKQAQPEMAGMHAAAGVQTPRRVDDRRSARRSGQTTRRREIFVRGIAGDGIIVLDLVTLLADGRFEVADEWS